MIMIIFSKSFNIAGLTYREVQVLSVKLITRAEGIGKSHAHTKNSEAVKQRK